MHQDEVTRFYHYLHKSSTADQWQAFTDKVKDNAGEEDNHKLVELSVFEKIVLDCLHCKLSSAQRGMLFNTSGRINNGVKQINISQIYSASF